MMQQHLFMLPVFENTGPVFPLLLYVALQHIDIHSIHGTFCLSPLLLTIKSSMPIC